MRHTSYVTRHTSHVTRQTSHVTRHTSHVTCHTSHVTRHTSNVNESPEIKGGDIQRSGGGAPGKRQRHQQQLPAVQPRYTSNVIRHTSHVTRHSVTSQDGKPHMKQQTALPPATAIIPPLLLTSSILKSRVTHASMTSHVTREGG
jgi:hypothetical protein